VCFCRNCANPVSVVDKVGPDVLMSWAARDWDLAFDITFLPGRGFADPLFEWFWGFSERTAFLLRSSGFDLPMSVISVVLQWPRRGHQWSSLRSCILGRSIPSWEIGKPARPRASGSLRIRPGYRRLTIDCLAGPLAVNLCVLAPQRQQNWNGILHFGECIWVVYLLGSWKRKKIDDMEHLVSVGMKKARTWPL
jgi:hypothetical protein